MSKSLSTPLLCSFATPVQLCLFSILFKHIPKASQQLTLQYFFFFFINFSIKNSHFRKVPSLLCCSLMFVIHSELLQSDRNWKIVWGAHFVVYILPSPPPRKSEFVLINVQWSIDPFHQLTDIHKMLLFWFHN